MRPRAAAVLARRPLGEFARLGHLIEALGAARASDPAGPAALVGLVGRASGLPGVAVEAILEGDEPAINFAPRALASLSGGLGLKPDEFLALLARDAGSFAPDAAAEDVHDALAAVRDAWAESAPD